jgi:predicted metal-dependent enzyme (double-stranded beta helix superfamily)
MTYNLPALLQFAHDYTYREADLPIRFAAEPYTRIPIYRDEQIEIVVICFASGQTSSVHNHQGCNCVIRVVRGKVLECLFSSAGDQLTIDSHHDLHAGELSGLDGNRIHQLSNLDPAGTVLLNFYSPPFKIGSI